MEISNEAKIIEEVRKNFNGLSFDNFIDFYGRRYGLLLDPKNINVYYTQGRRRKSNGTYRIIRMPDTELKEVQRRIDYFIKGHVYPSQRAHSVRNKSTKTMALPHVGKKDSQVIDIRDFFNTMSTDTAFKKMAKELSSVDEHTVSGMMGLCSFYDSPRQRWIIPTGSATATTICNVYMKEMDDLFGNTIKKRYDIDYTRYTDDMILSSDDDEFRNNLKYVFGMLYSLLDNLGLDVNKKKLRAMPYWKSQRVVGVQVNEKINIPKTYRRKLRASIHNMRMSILNKKREYPSREWLQSTSGKIAWVDFLSPLHGAKLKEQLEEVKII